MRLQIPDSEGVPKMLSFRLSAHANHLEVYQHEGANDERTDKEVANAIVNEVR